MKRMTFATMKASCIEIIIVQGKLSDKWYFPKKKHWKRIFEIIYKLRLDKQVHATGHGDPEGEGFCCKTWIDDPLLKRWPTREADLLTELLGLLVA